MTTPTKNPNGSSLPRVKSPALSMRDFCDLFFKGAPNLGLPPAITRWRELLAVLPPHSPYRDAIEAAVRDAAAPAGGELEADVERVPS